MLIESGVIRAIEQGAHFYIPYYKSFHCMFCGAYGVVYGKGGVRRCNMILRRRIARFQNREEDHDVL